MPAAEQNSEQSRLIGSNMPSRISYMNLVGNLSALIFVGGLGALYSLKLKHYLAPIYTKLLHASVGLLTITLGTVTIILAFYSEWFDFGEVLRYTNLVLVLIVMLFTILRPTLKVYFRLMERIENGN
ncbi:hypothetical protein MSG28_001536 [Choristoneura fumiferana]|uniref:Uncharacterized protein n=1 Tax=Choristoneura fumiferana TaxID=7141 RepID=A0ACC0KUF6_CHOFU|nr:hypothetical protein MSG28_001536 [Choristoneura fumiferana]